MPGVSKLYDALQLVADDVAVAEACVPAVLAACAPQRAAALLESLLDAASSSSCTVAVVVAVEALCLSTEADRRTEWAAPDLTPAVLELLVAYLRRWSHSTVRCERACAAAGRITSASSAAELLSRCHASLLALSTTVAALPASVSSPQPDELFCGPPHHFVALPLAPACLLAASLLPLCSPASSQLLEAGLSLLSRSRDGDARILRDLLLAAAAAVDADGCARSGRVIRAAAASLARRRTRAATHAALQLLLAFPQATPRLPVDGTRGAARAARFSDCREEQEEEEEEEAAAALWGAVCESLGGGTTPAERRAAASVVAGAIAAEEAEQRSGGSGDVTSPPPRVAAADRGAWRALLQLLSSLDDFSTHLLLPAWEALRAIHPARRCDADSHDNPHHARSNTDLLVAAPPAAVLPAAFVAAVWRRGVAHENPSFRRRVFVDFAASEFRSPPPFCGVSIPEPVLLGPLLTALSHAPAGTPSRGAASAAAALVASASDLRNDNCSAPCSPPAPAQLAARRRAALRTLRAVVALSKPSASGAAAIFDVACAACEAASPPPPAPAPSLDPNCPSLIAADDSTASDDAAEAIALLLRAAQAASAPPQPPPLAVALPLLRALRAVAPPPHAPADAAGQLLAWLLLPRSAENESPSPLSGDRGTSSSPRDNVVRAAAAQWLVQPDGGAWLRRAVAHAVASFVGGAAATHGGDGAHAAEAARDAPVPADEAADWAGAALRLALLASLLPTPAPPPLLHPSTFAPAITASRLPLDVDPCPLSALELSASSLYRRSHVQRSAPLRTLALLTAACAEPPSPASHPSLLSSAMRRLLFTTATVQEVASLGAAFAASSVAPLSRMLPRDAPSRRADAQAAAACFAALAAACRHLVDDPSAGDGAAFSRCAAKRREIEASAWAAMSSIHAARAASALWHEAEEGSDASSNAPARADNDDLLRGALQIVTHAARALRRLAATCGAGEGGEGDGGGARRATVDGLLRLAARGARASGGRDASWAAAEQLLLLLSTLAPPPPLLPSPSPPLIPAPCDAVGVLLADAVVSIATAGRGPGVGTLLRSTKILLDAILSNPQLTHAAASRLAHSATPPPKGSLAGGDDVRAPSSSDSCDLRFIAASLSAAVLAFLRSDRKPPPQADVASALAAALHPLLFREISLHTSADNATARVCAPPPMRCFVDGLLQTGCLSSRLCRAAAAALCTLWCAFPSVAELYAPQAVAFGLYSGPAEPGASFATPSRFDAGGLASAEGGASWVDASAAQIASQQQQQLACVFSSPGGDGDAGDEDDAAPAALRCTAIESDPLAVRATVVAAACCLTRRGAAAGRGGASGAAGGGDDDAAACRAAGRAWLAVLLRMLQPPPAAAAAAEEEAAGRRGGGGDTAAATCCAAAAPGPHRRGSPAHSARLRAARLVAALSPLLPAPDELEPAPSALRVSRDAGAARLAADASRVVWSILASPDDHPSTKQFIEVVATSVRLVSPSNRDTHCFPSRLDLRSRVPLFVTDVPVGPVAADVPRPPTADRPRKRPRRRVPHRAAHQLRGGCARGREALRSSAARRRAARRRPPPALPRAVVHPAAHLPPRPRAAGAGPGGGARSAVHAPAGRGREFQSSVLRRSL